MTFAAQDPTQPRFRRNRGESLKRLGDFFIRQKFCVFASFMMQNGIAIVAFFSLSCLRYLPPLRRLTSGKDNFDILVTAVVEFQKARCYFAGAIQIATVVLAAGQGSYSSDDWDDYINNEPFCVVATNGCLPVVFTLAYISKFGRRS